MAAGHNRRDVITGGATALGLLSVCMVGLLLQGWVLLGQMRSFFATAARDRKTRDQIELHATE